MPSKKYAKRTINARNPTVANGNISSCDVYDFVEATTAKKSTRSSSVKRSRNQKKAVQNSGNKENMKKNDNIDDNKVNKSSADENDHQSVCPICRMQFPVTFDLENRTIHTSQCGGMSNKEIVNKNNSYTSSKSKNDGKSSNSPVKGKSKDLTLSKNKKIAASKDGTFEKIEGKTVSRVDDGKNATEGNPAVIYVNNNGESTKTNHTNSDASDNCPVCNKAFLRGSTENQKHQHTNQCLDNSLNGFNATTDNVAAPSTTRIVDTSIHEQEKTDEILARTLQEQEDGQLAAEAAISNNTHTCQVCFKDITKLKIQQRLVHANTCMDKIEDIEGKSKQQLPTRGRKTNETKAKVTRTKEKKAATTKTKKTTAKKILKKQCPICASDQIETQYLNHIKQCAEKKKLTNYQLIQILNYSNTQPARTDSTLAAGSTKKNKKKSPETCTIVMPNEIHFLNGSVVEEQRNVFNVEQDLDEEMPSTPTLPLSELAGLLQEKGNGNSNEKKRTSSIFYKNEQQHLWSLSGYDLETKNSCFFRPALHPGIAEISNDILTSTEHVKFEDSLNPGEHDEKRQAIQLNETLDQGNGFIVDNTEDRLSKLQEESHFGILASFGTLLDSGEASDFTFLCSNSERVGAHKLILMSRCESLKKMIQAGENTADVSEYLPSVIGHMLKYLYCGALPTCSVQECKALYTLADRFEIEVLKGACLILNPSAGKEDETVGVEQEEHNEGEDEDFPLDELISTFWQQEQEAEGEGITESIGAEMEYVSTDRHGDDDSCFSDEEMEVMRDVFRSQRVNTSVLVDQDVNTSLLVDQDDLLEENLDPITELAEPNKSSTEVYVLTNKTIDNDVSLDSPRTYYDIPKRGILGDSPTQLFRGNELKSENVVMESPRSDHGDTLQHDVLGVSPHHPFESPPNPPRKASITGTVGGHSQGIFQVPQNIQYKGNSVLQKEPSNNSVSFTLNRKSSSKSTHSSLEALASNSVKTDLTVSSRANSHSSYASVGSAYADTLSIDTDNDLRTTEQQVTNPKSGRDISRTRTPTNTSSGGSTTVKNNGNEKKVNKGNVAVGEEKNWKGHHVTVVGEMEVLNKKEYDKLGTGDEISDVELIQILEKNNDFGNALQHSNSVYILKDKKKDAEKYGGDKNDELPQPSEPDLPKGKESPNKSKSKFVTANGSREIFEQIDCLQRNQNDDDNMENVFMTTDVHLLTEKANGGVSVEEDETNVRKTTLSLNGTIESTPIVLSCETPCVYNPATPKEDQTDSNYSLGNIVITTLEDENNTVRKGTEQTKDVNAEKQNAYVEVTIIDDSQHSITASESKISPSKKTNKNAEFNMHSNESSIQNYNADFQVSYTSTTTSKVLDPDVEEISMDKTGELTVESPCIARNQNSLRINTSTPYSVGTTKKQYLELRKKLCKVSQSSALNTSPLKRSNNNKNFIQRTPSHVSNSERSITTAGRTPTTLGRSPGTSGRPPSAVGSCTLSRSPNAIGLSPGITRRSSKIAGRSSKTPGRSLDLNIIERSPVKKKNVESIVIIDSQEKNEIQQSSCPEKNRKRKEVITSSSELDNLISSSSESVTYRCVANRKRKKRKRMSESFTAGIKRARKNVITESSDSDEESVSESDGPPLFSTKCKSVFKGAATPTRRKASNSQSRRRKETSKTSTGSPWLSTNSSVARPSTTKSSTSMKKKKKNCMEEEEEYAQNDGDNNRSVIQLCDDLSDNGELYNTSVAVIDVENDGDNVNDSIQMVDTNNENGDNLTDLISLQGNLDNVVDNESLLLPNNEHIELVKNTGDNYIDSILPNDNLEHVGYITPNTSSARIPSIAENDVDNLQESYKYNQENDNSFNGDNDMYFMDDGGYNSFNLEMPAGENDSVEASLSYNLSSSRNNPAENIDTRDNMSTNTNKESGLQNHDMDVMSDGDNMKHKNNIKVESTCNLSPNMPDNNENKKTAITSEMKKPNKKSILSSYFGNDSFDIEAIPKATSSENKPSESAKSNLYVPGVTTINKIREATKNAQFKTPENPGITKDACKKFGPGCSKHPETNEPITPMPNFAELPTPDLKDKIKKMAMRELPKEKMVSKLVEVYKYQHHFSHWEEEPPTKTKRKTRKANSKKQEGETAGTEESNDSEDVPKKKVRRQPTKKRTALAKDNEDVPETRNIVNTHDHQSQRIVGICSQGEEDEVTGTRNDETDDLSTKSNKNVKKVKLPTATDEDLCAFVENDMDLYQKVLSYQPIEGNQLFERIKNNASFTITKKAFEQFLDEQCICTKKEEGSKPTRKHTGRKRR